MAESLYNFFAGTAGYVPTADCQCVHWLSGLSRIFLHRQIVR